MRDTDRARLVAPAFVAAVAGSVSVGIAALAREGVCLHGLAALQVGTMPMHGMAMDGMTAPPMSGPCPILVVAALAAAALYVLALGAVLIARPSLSELAVVSARILLGLRFAPLAALLAVAGAVPLGAAIVMDGDLTGAAPLLAGCFLIVAAVLSAWVLHGIARQVLAFVRRLAVALAAAFRLLVPGADAPWCFVLDPLLVPAGVRLARRRPSRAPPVLR